MVAMQPNGSQSSFRRNVPFSLAPAVWVCRGGLPRQVATVDDHRPLPRSPARRPAPGAPAAPGGRTDRRPHPRPGRGTIATPCPGPSAAPRYPRRPDPSRRGPREATAEVTSLELDQSDRSAWRLRAAPPRPGIQAPLRALGTGGSAGRDGFPHPNSHPPARRRHGPGPSSRPEQGSIAIRSEPKPRPSVPTRLAKQAPLPAHGAGCPLGRCWGEGKRRGIARIQVASRPCYQSREFAPIAPPHPS
jgi:hypothetical protein